MLRKTPIRRGYVLVMTLGVIALAAISLGSLAQYSLGMASSAHDAAEELQRRWGLYSARLVLLEDAAEIIDAQVPAEQANTPPWPRPASISAKFNLGSYRFSVVLADEDAKANINTIYARKRDSTLSAIRNLSASAGRAAPLVRLSPMTGNAKPFASWGQVFDLASLSTPNVADAVMDASQHITCWGKGRLNLRRASDSTVREIASLALSAKEVGELLELRQHWGGQAIEDLFSQMELRRPQLLAIKRLLSTESRHYSMWVEIDNGQRVRSYLYVEDNGITCFAW